MKCIFIKFLILCTCNFKLLKPPSSPPPRPSCADGLGLSAPSPRSSMTPHVIFVHADAIEADGLSQGRVVA